MAGLKLMTFNTMCDFCKGSDFFDYDLRVIALNNIVNFYRPSLIALQEVRSKSQLEKIVLGDKNRGIICTEYGPFSYADPAIVYDKSVLKLLEQGQAWLGPNHNRLNFGWKWALPRQIIWGKFLHLTNQQTFIFMTGHFDNRIENLEGAAKLTHDIISQQNIPVIFAGDTNLTTDLDIYQSLLGDTLINAFALAKKKHTTFKRSEKDLCYLKKGKTFPECRVDHFLLSKKDKWIVENYHIDLTQNYRKKYPSDHRPVLLELELSP